MIEGITIQLALRIASAIIVLWFTSVAIRRSGTVWPFAPLFIYFIALSATASAEFYEIFITELQTVFDATFLVFYAWLLLTIMRLVKRKV